MPKEIGTKSKYVFLFDVDNTLLNNDAVTADIREYLEREVGPQRNKSYWKIFERLRSSLGYADYLGALQTYRRNYPHDLHLLQLSRFLINYPFANRLYPGSLDAIRHVRKWGTTALLSDGDVVFQPRKVERSSLSEVVEGRVMIYVHKEKELKDVERRHAASHYVLIDDKLRILTAVKKIWRTRVTTVFVRQGHYALDPKILAKYPPADVDIQSIGDIVKLELEELVCGRATTPRHKSR
jgi:FMN phosphatase YigB (HAD superfamily)